MRKYFVFCLIIHLSLTSFCVANDPVAKEVPDAEIILKSEDNNPLEKEPDASEESKELDLSSASENEQESVKDPQDGKEQSSSEETSAENDQEKNASNEKEIQEESKEKMTSIRINEVLPNPDGTDSGNEFIELYNYGDDAISLKDWELFDKTNKPYVFDDITIASQDYLTLYNKKDFSFSLNNSDEEIILKDTSGTTVAQFSYKNSSSGRSWNYSEDEWYEESPTPNEKNNENPLTKDYPAIVINEVFPNPLEDEENNEFIELYNPFDEDISLKNWSLTDASSTGKYVIDDVTIASKSYVTIYRSTFSFALNNSGDETVSLIAPNGKIMSSVSYTASREGRTLNRAEEWYWEKPTPDQQNRDNPLTKTYPNLILSEVLPNPSGDESSDEFIELYNPNDHPVDLDSWVLRDASASGAYTFMESEIIAPRSYFVIYRKTFSFALNNSNETVSFIAPNEKIMSTLTYKSSKEDVSHNYQQSTHKWRQSKHLTPGKENIFNNLPEITKLDIDSRAYKDVYAEFSVHASDKDEEELKVRWDFGDGRKSYKWNTRHKYTEIGIYHGRVRIQDESEEIEKEFIVTVKKYPKHEVVITKIVPNPAGKDVGNEYIVIENRSDKKIDLKNWSIATGAKKKTLVNHPIYDDLSLKKGKTKVIKKEHAAISLPNKKGVIEIRRPDGSISDHRVYGEKNVAIPDNASYEKIDGHWQWVIPFDAETERQTNAIIARALENEKIFSQRRLEQKIAYATIHDSHRDHPTDMNHTNHIDFFKDPALFLNQFFNKIITFAQDLIKNKNERSTKKDMIAIYTIDHDTDPCENVHMPTKKKYDLCDQNIAKTLQKWDDE